MATLTPRLFHIDGKTYDLSKFVEKHPGGDDILLFEGIDCSLHYKMLHHKPFDHENMKKYLF
jgi:cytochrome b involved in lipid metabolism